MYRYLFIDSNLVESVDSFVYLGSLQYSDGYYHPDLKHSIGFASSTVASLIWVWKDKQFTLHTELHLYRPWLRQSYYMSRNMDCACSGCKGSGSYSCVMSMSDSQWLLVWPFGMTKLLYALVFLPLWIAVLQNADVHRLALLLVCLRLSLQIKPLCCHVDVSLDWPLHSTWKCRPGHLCNSWLEQICRDSGSSPTDLSCRVVKHRHRTMLRPRLAMHWWCRLSTAVLCGFSGQMHFLYGS